MILCIFSGTNIRKETDETLQCHKTALFSYTCFISINSFIKYGVISDKSILFLNCEMVPCQNSFSFSYFFCLNSRSFWRTCNRRWRLVSDWQPWIHRSSILTSTELLQHKDFNGIVWLTHLESTVFKQHRNYKNVLKKKHSGTAMKRRISKFHLQEIFKCS